jgi:hypothetical protein
MLTRNTRLDADRPCSPPPAAVGVERSRNLRLVPFSPSLPAPRVKPTAAMLRHSPDQTMRPMFALRMSCTLLVLALVGCTSTGDETGGPTPGSDAWYETASPKQIANYFRSQCVAYGYMPGTPEMAECIGKEASAAKQTNVARSAAIAAATAGY